MNKKLLLSLGLLSVPFMAYANAGVQFTIYNNSPTIPTIPNPITITAGYISYSFMPPTPDVQLPAHCTNQTIVDLNDPSSGTSLPISIKYGAGFPFTFASLPTDCFVTNSYGESSWAWVYLSITQLEGKINKQGTCNTQSVIVNSKISTASAGLVIMETTDNNGNLDSFTCIASQFAATKK